MNSATWQLGQMAVVAAIATSLVVLDLLDVDDTHLGSTGLDAPVAAASFALLPWTVAALLVAFARLIAHLALRRTLGGASLPSDLLARLLSGATAVGCLALLRAGRPPEVAAAVAAASYITVSFASSLMLMPNTLSNFAPRRFVAKAKRDWALLAAQASVTILAVLVVGNLGWWSLVLIVALLLVMHQAQRLLLELNQTYDQTVRVIVEAVESHRQDRLGHAKRVNDMALSIGRRLGLSDGALQRLGYAALLHDVGRDAGLSDESRSAAVAREAAFLGDAHPALEVLDAGFADGSGVEQAEILNAFIVALASDADDIARGHSVGQPLAPGIADALPRRVRGRVVGAAVALGYPVPSIR